MKKTTLFLTLLLIGVSVTQAQRLNSYTVSTDYAPYVSIASTGTQLTSVVGDQGWQTFAMPFDFAFGENLIAQGTEVVARADGHITLDRLSVPAGHPMNGYDYAYRYYNEPYYHFAIVPFLLVDGQMPAGNSACYWQTVDDGNGEQTLIVEFQHVQHYNATGNDDFNYQIHIHSNGNISAHYGHMENHSTDTSFNFMMVAKGLDERIILRDSWDPPMAVSPSGITLNNNNNIYYWHCLGLPDSGLVVTYERPEPPCPRPENIRIANLSSTSVTLMWTPNSVGGCTYLLEYDTVSRYDSWLGNSIDGMTNDSVFYIDTLLPNHHYYMYLMSHCGSDSSNWQSFDFWTPCDPIPHSALPFTENFNNTPTAGYIFNPGCWRKSTYASIVNGNSQHPTKYLHWATGSDSAAMLSLPPMDNVADLEISFSARNDDGLLEVGVLDEAGHWESFVPVQTVNLPRNTWIDRSVRLNSYTGTGNIIAFRFSHISSYSALLYLDDIDIHLAEGCSAVEDIVFSNITDTSVTASWNDPGHSGSYRVTITGVGQPFSFTTTNTTVNITGLTLNSDYNVSVVALCTAGMSDAVSATFHTLNSCVPPTNITCTGVTSTSVSVSWNEPFAVTAYEVTCGTQTLTVTGATSCSFSGLNPNTEYTVTVRRQCANGLTDADTTTFTTECPAISTLPWSEDFETWPSNSFGDCWTRHEGPDSYSRVTFYESRDIRCLRMRCEIYLGDTNCSYAVLPPMAMNYNGLSLSFNVMGSNSDSSNTRLELGVLTDGSDPSTFIAFDTVPFANRLFASWDYYERSLDGIGNGRLALRCTSLDSYKAVYLDNFTLSYSASCAYPDSLTVSGASQTSLTANIADDDSISHYRLWWTDGLTVDSADFTGYTHTLTGLRHSTRYTLSVAAICPIDGTLSTAISTTAATACGVITHAELPFVENFDNGINLCSSFHDYHFPNNSGDRTTTGSYRGDTGKSLAPNVGGNNEPFFYILPAVDSLNDLALEFWLKMSRYYDNDMVTVGVMTDPADTTTFEPIQTVYPTVADQWEPKHVSLGSYSGSGRHVAMRFGLISGTWSWQPRVDDLSLLPDLPCQMPDSITVASVTDSSATLVVHGANGADHYRLYFNGDTVDFQGDTVTIGGLAIATDYRAWIATVCSDSTVTFPVHVDFTTDCGVYPLPYLETFDPKPTTTLLRCWKMSNLPTQTPSVFTNSSTGETYLYGSVYDDSLTTVTTPQFHFTENEALISFKVYVYHSYADELHHPHYLPMRMQVSYFGDSLNQPLVLLDDSIMSNSLFGGDHTWHTIDINTSDIPLGNGELYFTFYRDSISNLATFYIDSLSISTFHHIPPCRPVELLEVSDVSLSSARISWQPRGIETEWEMLLTGPALDSLILCDSTYAVVSGLEQGTRYSVSVRPLCTDGQLLWSDTVAFSTNECTQVNNVAVSAITAHSALVTWQAPTEGPWTIAYGPAGFQQGHGNTLTVPVQPGVDTHYVTLTNLESETLYDVYVMTLCEEGMTSVWSDLVSFSTATDGIDDIDNATITLYPNPSHSTVTINTNSDRPLHAVLLDMSGHAVANFEIRNSKYVIDVSNLTPGAYFIRITDEQSTVVRKLIVD